MTSSGNIVYNIGIAWLAYQLTNSALIVGSLNSMRTLSILLLGPFISVLLDRTHRPTVLKCNAAFVALLSAGFLTLLLSGGLETWHLYVYMLLVGVGFAVGASARRAVYADSVDSSLLLNALSLDLLGFEVVRVAAPALVGLVVALWGVPAAFAGQLALYTAVFFALLPVRAKSHDIRSVSQHSPLHNLREGLTYAAHQPIVAASLILSLVVFLVGPDIFFFVLPVYVRDTLHLGAEGVGLLGSASAVGGILGGLVASSLGHRYGKGALLATACPAVRCGHGGRAGSVPGAERGLYPASARPSAARPDQHALVHDDGSGDLRRGGSGCTIARLWCAADRCVGWRLAVGRRRLSPGAKAGRSASGVGGNAEEGRH
ncbi:MAG: MFS transporter [Dehalococcoidia bacterium]|nr:MFS transporter [Dehalococcoidia bacterium]